MSKKNTSIKSDELNNKQKNYCHYRSLGQTQTQAAKQAGYNQGYGTTLESNPAIREHIQKLKDERLELGEVSYEEQCRRYNEIYFEAKNSGNYKVAMEALAKLDDLGGFVSKAASGGSQVHNTANILIGDSSSRGNGVDQLLEKTLSMLSGGSPTLPVIDATPSTLVEEEVVVEEKPLEEDTSPKLF